jgi:hypothetical protein
VGIGERWAEAERLAPVLAVRLDGLARRDQAAFTRTRV